MHTCVLGNVHKQTCPKGHQIPGVSVTDGSETSAASLGLELRYSGRAASAVNYELSSSARLLLKCLLQHGNSCSTFLGINSELLSEKHLGNWTNYKICSVYISCSFFMYTINKSMERNICIRNQIKLLII